VQTLLNSGNALFTGDTQPADEHATRIRAAVHKKLGVDALVIVKSAKDIAGVIAGNELASIATDGSRLLIALTRDARALAALKSLARAQWGEEQLHVGKHAAYMWCANGILESKVAVALLRNLDDAGTTRNWSTLNKIHSLLQEKA